MTTAYACLTLEFYLEFATVVAGSYDIQNPDEQIQILGITKVEPHEDFVLNTLENDICVITLNDSLTLDDQLYDL